MKQRGHMLLVTALGLAIKGSLAAETPPAISILPPDPSPPDRIGSSG